MAGNFAHHRSVLVQPFMAEVVGCEAMAALRIDIRLMCAWVVSQGTTTVWSATMTAVVAMQFGESAATAL